jgi:hypothetical protein
LITNAQSAETSNPSTANVTELAASLAAHASS